MTDIAKIVTSQDRLIRKLYGELEEVTDLIDDILFDPTFKPVDHDGKRITGNDLYLLDHPVQERHMPALRQWFVSRNPEN